MAQPSDPQPDTLATVQPQGTAEIMASLEQAVVQIDALSARELLTIRALFLQLFDSTLANRKDERAALQATLEMHTKKALLGKLPEDLAERLRLLEDLSESFPADAMLSALVAVAREDLRAAHKDQAIEQENTAKDVMAHVGSSARIIDDEDEGQAPSTGQGSTLLDDSDAETQEDDDGIDPVEAELIAFEAGKTPYMLLERILLERSASVFRYFVVENDQIAKAARSEDLPFYLQPAFSARLHDYLKTYVMPEVLSHKYTDTRILCAVRERPDLSLTTQLQKLIDLDPKGREVMAHVWNDVWDDLTEAITGEPNPKASDAAKRKRKATRQAWKALVKGVTFGDNNHPTAEDIRVIRAAFFWPKPLVIADTLKGVFESISHENEGASSEGWVAKYLGDLELKEADHFGDMVALWAYYVHLDVLIEPRDTGGTLLKSFLSSQGKTMHERQQRAGLVLRFGIKAKEITKDWR